MQIALPLRYGFFGEETDPLNPYPISTHFPLLILLTANLNSTHLLESGRPEKTRKCHFGERHDSWLPAASLQSPVWPRTATPALASQLHPSVSTALKRNT